MNKNTKRHRRFFSPLAPDNSTSQGRFDAVEYEDGKIIILYPRYDLQLLVCDTFEEACRYARAISLKWKPEWDVRNENS